jgi:branched-chain amino acid transport system permease protein
MLDKAHKFLFLALAVCIGISFFSGRIDPYRMDILVTIGFNIILAVSLNLINGYTGQFSLGHAGFMAVGAYTSAAFSLKLGPEILKSMGNGPFQVGLLFAVALVVGGLVAGISGLLVGAPSLRLRGDYLAIATLGFGEIIRVIFRNMESVGGALGLNGIPPYTTFLNTFIVAILTTYVVVCLVHSSYGRGFIAVHDDEVAADAMGINTTRYKITAFVIGAFFAGIAGGLYGHFKLSIDPKGFDFMKSIEIVVMVILGGMGNTTGVIAAAALLTILPELLRDFRVFGVPLSDYRMVLYSLLLIVLMLTRPQGLFTFRKGKTVLVS